MEEDDASRALATGVRGASKIGLSFRSPLGVLRFGDDASFGRRALFSLLLLLLLEASTIICDCQWSGSRGMMMNDEE